MRATTFKTIDCLPLWVPVVLLAALLALIVSQFAPARVSFVGQVEPPATVVVPERAFSYRLSGEFVRGGVPIDAPMAQVEGRALEVMTYQVSAAEYGRCVTEGACEAAEPRRRIQGDVPATGVSFDDANAYAAWLSARTGQNWRLPSEAEWAQAAGSRYPDNALGLISDGSNPADRWLANYEREAALGLEATDKPMPLGSFGFNEYGVADLGGSVWEWTSTCDGRTRLDHEGNALSTIRSCGVRLLAGRHLTAMSTFVRDGKSGACSVGAPPDNLGFRLVRDRAWYEDLVGWLASLTA